MPLYVTPAGPMELAELYLGAKRVVVDSGYAGEMEWQRRVGERLDPVTEKEFLSEAAWVVFNAGMRESVVRSKWAALSDAFLLWRSAREVTDHASECSAAALSVFGHVRKVQAAVAIAGLVADVGISQIRMSMDMDPEVFLTELPYVGAVTWRHLAKNLGLQMVKEDRHLVRLAGAWGRPSADDMCREIADWLGEPLSVVDLVLWRWCALGAPASARQPAWQQPALF